MLTFDFPLGGTSYVNIFAISRIKQHGKDKLNESNLVVKVIFEGKRWQNRFLKSRLCSRLKLMKWCWCFGPGNSSPTGQLDLTLTDTGVYLAVMSFNLMLTCSDWSVLMGKVDAAQSTLAKLCCVVRLQRQTGGVAVGPQAQLPGVVHPQQQYYPSQPLYPEDIPLQEVPSGHDMCPTGNSYSSTVIIRCFMIWYNVTQWICLFYSLDM